jgi:ribosomal protein S11
VGVLIGEVTGVLTLDAAAVFGTTYAFTVTATDAAGNHATTDQFLVTVNDITKPIAIAQNFTVALGVNGTAVITAAQININSTDNSGGTLTYALDKTTFDCDDLVSGSSSEAITPIFVGSIAQDTRGNGGGYNPNTNEFWYPEWSGSTVHKYSSEYAYIESFDSGQTEMSQLWMDTDSETDYYTANWTHNTITKRSGNTTVWSYNIGTKAAAVSSDAEYVYALGWAQNKIHVLNKETGVYVKEIILPGVIYSRTCGRLA